MKTPKHTIAVLLIAAIATYAITAADQSASAAPSTPQWEYAIEEGDPTNVKNRMQDKLNKGFQVDHIVGTAKGNGHTPHIFAILKREKKSAF